MLLKITSSEMKMLQVGGLKMSTNKEELIYLINKEVTLVNKSLGNEVIFESAC